MQKEANTILLFTEHRVAIDYLSDEDAGKLIKTLFAYVDESKLPDSNRVIAAALWSIQATYQRTFSILHHSALNSGISSLVE